MVEWILHFDADNLDNKDVISRFRDSSRVAAVIVLLPVSNMASFFSMLHTRKTFHTQSCLKLIKLWINLDGCNVDNYIWIFPEISFTDDVAIKSVLPRGSISFYSALKDDSSEVVSRITQMIMNAAEQVKSNQTSSEFGQEDARIVNSLTCLKDQNIDIHIKQGSQLLKYEVYITAWKNDDLGVNPQSRLFINSSMHHFYSL